MKIWLDAQLSPRLAAWVSSEFQVEAVAIRDLGLRDAPDRVVFDAARQAGAVVMTKDIDFVDLVTRCGMPPQVIWVTSGNTSNARMRAILASAFRTAMRLIEQGEPVVEITEPTSG